jgi:ElaB/YqjD/DUF883 family membrane-anchored ribosome-binding protein
MQRQNERMSGGVPETDPTAEGGVLLGGAAMSDSERFLADLKTFVNDTEGLLRQAKTLSGEAALAAREEFERRLEQARRGYDQARAAASTHAHDYRERAETYVRDEPMKAIGIAALIGAVLGVLIARR